MTLREIIRRLASRGWTFRPASAIVTHRRGYVVYMPSGEVYAFLASRDARYYLPQRVGHLVYIRDTNGNTCGTIAKATQETR